MLELLERQKTLTSNQWKIIATANLGNMLDFFDFFLIGYVPGVHHRRMATDLRVANPRSSCCRRASAR